MARLSAKVFSINSIPVILQAYRWLRQWLKREAHEGLYEVLEYDSQLELTDSSGEKATFKKRQRIKFLQDNVIAFQDFAWGEGDLFKAYRCSPGTVVDRYRDGDRWNVLISLRETKHSGDVEDFYIEQTVTHGFVRSDEWWQIEMQHQTRWLKLAVIFPPQRRCQHAVLVERMQNRTIELDARNFTELPDGRQVLTWETKKPRRFETYTFQWRW